MNLSQFISIFRARLGLILAIIGSLVGLALVASLVMTPKYTSTATVLLDVKSPDPLNGGPNNMLPAHLLPSFIATQTELVTSPLVAERVVTALKLDQDPATVAQYNASPEPRGPLKSSIAAGLAKQVTVKAARESNMLNISYTGANGQAVADITNAFVRAYIDTTVDMRTAPARQSSQFFDEQSKRLRQNLLDAQKRLSDFQRTNGITSGDERLDAENARLLELSSQLSALQGLTIEGSRRSAGAGASATEVQNSPVIIALKTNLNNLEATFNQRSAVLGPNHPDIIRLQSEITSVRSRIAQETALIASGLDRNKTVNVQREADVRAAYERQRQRVLQIRESRDRMAVLQRDVAEAQRALDGVSQRLTDATLESRATQATIVPVMMATPAARPSRPNPPLYVAIAFILGSILSAAVVLIMEMLSPKVRGAEDLYAASGATVLGVFDKLPHRSINAVRAALPRAGATALPDGVSKRQRLSHESGRRRAPQGEDLAVMEADHPDEVAESTGGDPAAEALIDSGLIETTEVAGVNAHMAKTGLRFGDAAVALGLVTKQQVTGALALRSKMPLLDANHSPVAHEVFAAFDGHHPFLDELRSLRSLIKSRWLDRADNARKSIAVVSHSPGEGKSFTAANLAVSFVQMGERTLLIDGDMRKGRMHALFALDNSNGLSTLLGLKCSPAQAVRTVPGLPELSVITAGPEVPNATDLLARDTLAFLLDRFAQAYDVIIIDTPSSLSKPDASLIAASTKGAILVARENASLSQGIKQVAKTMREIGSTLVGSVLVKA